MILQPRWLPLPALRARPIVWHAGASSNLVGKRPKYRRVLLKISGEALMADREFGLDPTMVAQVASEIKSVSSLGVEVCLVIGGGNIFRRGVSASADGMERASADYMGMLATVINALAVQSALETIGSQLAFNLLYP